MGNISIDINKNEWTFKNKYSILVLLNKSIDNNIPVIFMQTKPYFRKNKGFGKELFVSAINFVKQKGFNGIIIRDYLLTNMAKKILDQYIVEERGVLQNIGGEKYYVFIDENKI